MNVIYSSTKNLTRYLKKHLTSLSNVFNLNKINHHNELSLNEEGYRLLQEGNLTKAEDYFRNALSMNANLHEARSNLGQTLRLMGKLHEAEQHLRDVIATSPTNSIDYNRFATTLRELGNDQEAEFYYRQGLIVNPHDADILNNLGSMLNQYGHIIEATDYFKKAVTYNPTHAIAQCNLCVNLSDRGLHEEANQCFIQAIALDPTYYYPRISYVMNKLHAIHQDEKSLENCRSEYETALLELRDWLLTQPANIKNSAAETVGWISPFYLTYQGKNDRYLQSIYGNLICQLMAHRYPEFASRPSMPTITQTEPLRIGIVSAFFYDHSNWKTPIRGWLENINNSQFHIFGYYTGTEQDEVTIQAKKLCYRFYENISFESIANQIKKDQLHALIFPEISMNPITTKLAALRLAPIQCNSWGHPDTSGMPTIDYYLSSALMEPAEGQSHYTEELICLPNLSIAYTSPGYKSLANARKDFGLDEGKILYCCAQSLFKYLPQFDYIFPRIAKSVPAAQFVFFGHQKSNELTNTFVKRICNAFQKEGIDPSTHVVMLTRLDRHEFQTALKLCDIYLDSIEWSGCNTTLEAFLCDIPVITYKGSMMRGRHTYAFLKMMGLDNLISSTLDTYINMAIKLGKDSNLRKEIAALIKNNFPLICNDISCVRALEAFLIEKISAY